MFQILGQILIEEPVIKKDNNTKSTMENMYVFPATGKAWLSNKKQKSKHAEFAFNSEISMEIMNF